MIEIKDANCGVLGIATQIEIQINPHLTSATSCQTYYRLCDKDGKMLAQGNTEIKEEQFAKWGDDNTYIEDIVLAELKLTRK